MDLYDNAACRGKSKLFFSFVRDDQLQAAELCAGCPVRGECEAEWRSLPYALRPEGVWAGHNVLPRRKNQARPGRRPFAASIVEAVPDEWTPLTEFVTCLAAGQADRQRIRRTVHAAVCSGDVERKLSGRRAILIRRAQREAVAS